MHHRTSFLLRRQAPGFRAIQQGVSREIVRQRDRGRVSLGTTAPALGLLLDQEHMTSTPERRQKVYLASRMHRDGYLPERSIADRVHRLGRDTPATAYIDERVSPYAGPPKMGKELVKSEELKSDEEKEKEREHRLKLAQREETRKRMKMLAEETPEERRRRRRQEKRDAQRPSIQRGDRQTYGGLTSSIQQTFSREAQQQENELNDAGEKCDKDKHEDDYTRTGVESSDEATIQQELSALQSELEKLEQAAKEEGEKEEAEEEKGATTELGTQSQSRNSTKNSRSKSLSIVAALQCVSHYRPEDYIAAEIGWDGRPLVAPGMASDSFFTNTSPHSKNSKDMKTGVNIPLLTESSSSSSNSGANASSRRRQQRRRSATSTTAAEATELEGGQRQNNNRNNNKNSSAVQLGEEQQSSLTQQPSTTTLPQQRGGAALPLQQASFFTAAVNEARHSAEMALKTSWLPSLEAAKIEAVMALSFSPSSSSSSGMMNDDDDATSLHQRFDEQQRAAADAPVPSYFDRTVPLVLSNPKRIPPLAKLLPSSLLQADQLRRRHLLAAATKATPSATSTGTEAAAITDGRSSSSTCSSDNKQTRTQGQKDQEAVPASSRSRSAAVQSSNSTHGATTNPTSQNQKVFAMHTSVAMIIASANSSPLLHSRHPYHRMAGVEFPSSSAPTTVSGEHQLQPTAPLFVAHFTPHLQLLEKYLAKGGLGELRRFLGLMAFEVLQHQQQPHTHYHHKKAADISADGNNGAAAAAMAKEQEGQGDEENRKTKEIVQSSSSSSVVASAPAAALPPPRALHSYTRTVSLRVYWKQEEIAAYYNSGIKKHVEVEKSKYGNNKMRTTSEGQVKSAMAAVRAEWLAQFPFPGSMSVPLADDDQLRNTSPSTSEESANEEEMKSKNNKKIRATLAFLNQLLQLKADKHVLDISLKVPSHVVLPATATSSPSGSCSTMDSQQQQPSALSTSALSSRVTAAGTVVMPQSLSSTILPPLHNSIGTVDCVLIRRGLPHSFVVEDIAHRIRLLRAQQQQVALSSFSSSPSSSPIRVSSRSAGEPNSESHQLIRIHGVSLLEVSMLAAELERPTAWLASASSTSASVSATTMDQQGNKQLDELKWNDDAKNSLEVAERPFLTNKERQLLRHRIRRHGVQDQLEAASHARRQAHERFFRTSFYTITDVKSSTSSSSRDETETTTSASSLQLNRGGATTATATAASSSAAAGEGGDLVPSPPLSSALVAGFRFKVTLRFSRHADAQLAPLAAKQLEKTGFLNYFAMHRFGAYTRRGSMPGIHLLRGEFRVAAHCLIDCSDDADGALPFDRNLAGGDGGRKDLTPLARQLARAMRALGINEKEVLQSQEYMDSKKQNSNSNNKSLVLRKEEGESDALCREAFLQGLGIAGCRSLIQEALALCWNRSVSARVRKYGAMTIRVGDLVRPRPRLTHPPHSFSTKNTSTFIKSLGFSSSAEADDEGEKEAEGEDQLAAAPIYVATQEDIDNGTFTPWDVVLPVPGAGMVLPQQEDGGDAAAIISAVSTLCGVDVDAMTGRWSLFESDHNALGIDVTGTYRYILEYPRDFTLRVTQHREEVSVKNKDGVVSASDMLAQVEQGEGSEKSVGEKERKKELQRDPCPYRLTLYFSLPSSAYPNMLLREFSGASSCHGCRWDILQKVAKSSDHDPAGRSHLDATSDDIAGDDLANQTTEDRLKQILLGGQDGFARGERMTEMERKRLEMRARQSAFNKNAHGGRALHEARITNAIFYSPTQTKKRGRKNRQESDNVVGIGRSLKHIKENLPRRIMG